MVFNFSELCEIATVNYKGLYVVKAAFPNLDKNTLNELSELAISNDGLALQFVDSPTEKMQLLAIKSNGLAIQFIKNPSEKIQLLAVKNDGLAIQYLPDASDVVKRAAVVENPEAFKLIKNPSEHVIEAMILHDYTFIKKIKNPSPQLQVFATSAHKEAIIYISSDLLCEEAALNSIRREAQYYEYYKNPNNDFNHKAVISNPYTIFYIKEKNRTEELELLALQKTNIGLAQEMIKKIKNLSLVAVKNIIEQYPQMIQYVKNPDEELQMIAVNKARKCLFYIENPTENVQYEAVRRYKSGIHAIKHPVNGLKEFHKLTWG